MKALAATILTFLVLVQSFSQWLIMAEYALNKDFIAKNLCINKARPQLHCHGKCQMMKKMAEEERENSAGNSKMLAKIKLPEVFFSNPVPALPRTIEITTTVNKSRYIIPLYTAPPVTIFHPPAA